MKTITDKKIQKYARDFSIPTGLAKILANRFPEYITARKFLFPDLKDLHPPELLPDIDWATEVILDTIKEQSGILIYCHDDLDGYTSAAIMFKTLFDLKWRTSKPIYVYAINREKDGYIINPEVLKKFQDNGVALILTVDFGISNIKNFSIPEKMGLKIVICDHHETDINKFSAPAVDPKRPNSNYPFRELAGVGVAFKLSQALYKYSLGIEAGEFYELKKEFLSLAMIGTIADRVANNDENRIISYYGLKFLDQLNTPWIEYFKQKEKFNLRTITREFIPIISSSAYVQANLGVEIFIDNDKSKVNKIISQLEKVNQKRKKETERIFNDVLKTAKVYEKFVLVILTIKFGYHYIGVVASRLRDYFKKTSIIIGEKDKYYIGELRSYDINLFDLLSRMKHLFLDFGGHKKAAGFSMPRKNIDQFIEELQKGIDELSRNNAIQDSRTPRPEAFIKKSDIQILEPLMPFGETNPAPILTDGVSLYTIDNKFRIIEMG